MAISTKTAKMLWGRAAGRCSMPECRIQLVIDAAETDDSALIGEMAHMVAEKPDGPRGDAQLTAEKRDLYSNLLLLCRNHHGLIDRLSSEWSVMRLQQIKKEHEEWVSKSLPDYDASTQRDGEIYAGYIDEWSGRAHLADWTEWTSSIFAHGQPSLNKNVRSDLDELCRWLMKRVWPRRYPELESAMSNFFVVLKDFLAVFDLHAEERSNDQLWTRKIYHINEFDTKRYSQLLQEYEDHVDLVQDLGLELTRAANLICDKVRSTVLPSYHLSEGSLSIQSGPNMHLQWVESVVVYSSVERSSPKPYQGLEIFKSARFGRDMCFAEAQRTE